MNTFEGSYGFKESGVLMPFRAMPGPDHQGTYGEQANDFLGIVDAMGCRIVHDLPSSPPDKHESPYSSVSAFAIDPQRIDLEKLVEVQDLSWSDLGHYLSLVQSGDAGPEIKYEKEALLHKAFLRFLQEGSLERIDSFTRWRQTEAGWLDSFAAYELLKELPENRGKQWQTWQYGKERSVQLVAELKTSREEDFDAICYKQWIANEQTMDYVRRAEELGIEIWGDVPFYVGEGEIWANREIFNLNDEGYQLNQGGAAPSQTSETGQLWGFATYKYGNNESPEQNAKVLDWWGRRLARQRTLNNGKVRLDHFIGFAEPYIIEADAKDGLSGWRDEGIGYGLFDRENERNDVSSRYYPEDLGTQTEKTGELRDHYGFAVNTIAVRGLTKCLVQGQYHESIHNPDNYRENSVNMVSNHDMMPLVGTLDNIRSENPESFQGYVDYVNHTDPYRHLRSEASTQEVARFEMERVMRSAGRVAIVAVWDVLGLGADGRYNVPAKVLPENWSWRMDSTLMSKFRSEVPYWSELNAASGRSLGEMSAAAAD